MKKYFLRAVFVATLIFATSRSQTTVNAIIPEEPIDSEITDEISAEEFDLFNPLIIAGDTESAAQLSTPGGIVTRALNFLFPLAGLILFTLISWGGFEMMISSSDAKGVEAGKNRVTAAIVGFILLFSSYWIAQVVEMIFGITIL